MRDVSSTEFHKNLTIYLNDIVYMDDEIKVTRHGKELGVLISVEKWKKMKKICDRVKVID